MQRVIIVLPTFERKLIRLLKYHPDLDVRVEQVLRLLQKNLKMPVLKVHKLKGRLKDSYACSVDYRYRIVFSFDLNFIYLESIGSHDEVY